METLHSRYYHYRRNTMEHLGWAYLAAGLGAALTIIGAGLGIGKLAAAAMEASGRQPEAAGAVRTSMIIAAALIEGATFFSLVICILLALK
jgi:F-type H+-transporting ATPase subunit c